MFHQELPSSCALAEALGVIVHKFYLQCQIDISRQESQRTQVIYDHCFYPFLQNVSGHNILSCFQMSCETTDNLEKYKSRRSSSGTRWMYCRYFEKGVKKVVTSDRHNPLIKSSFGRCASALCTEEKCMTKKASLI